MPSDNTTVPNIGWNFDNSYMQLPVSLYQRLFPIPVKSPNMVIFNHALAKSLGLNFAGFSEKEMAQFFSGNKLPSGSDPLAQAYAGHQFGHFTILGDGRALILGEQLTPNGQRFDIALKGSGKTPYSRRGDGRAALAPMLREYIISEALYSLGIATTRSLAVIGTGESVFREKPLPGAILTRVAASHIRVGTFEYLAWWKDTAALKQLADYTIARHYPEAAKTSQPYVSLLNQVIERQALLVASWLKVGFVHGVMNTDNMAISGETLDYGPCAFLDAYDPDTAFSSIDEYGRYAYANQAHIAQWNLARFAEALLPLLDVAPKKAVNIAKEAVASFGDLFQRHWLAAMHKKLGLFNEEPGDVMLINSLLQWLERSKADYTYSFRALSSDTLLEQSFFQDLDFKDWHKRWQARLLRNSKPAKLSYNLMRAHNPAMIPRNHLVEAALSAASTQNDYSVMHLLLAALANPYDDSLAYAEYQKIPPRNACRYQTFCGT
jgi:serine/tyrosine/threonine adenylyltransferase